MMKQAMTTHSTLTIVTGYGTSKDSSASACRVGSRLFPKIVDSVVMKRGLQMQYTRLPLFVLLALSMYVSACAASGETSPASTPAAPSNVALRKLAQAHTILIGAAVNVHALQSDQTYATLLGQQFNALTAENAMKFDAI